MKNRPLALVIGGLLLGAFAVSKANAANFTPYTDVAAFNAAVGSAVVEDWEDTTLVPGLTITSDVATISGGNYNDVIDTNGGHNPTHISTSFALKGLGGILHLDAGGTGSGIATLVYLVGGGAQLFGPVVPDGYNGFIGLTSDVPFNAIDMFSGGPGSPQAYTAENLILAPVPVPGALPLMASALAGLIMVRRKRTA